MRLGPGLQTTDYGLPTTDYGLPTPDYGVITLIADLIAVTESLLADCEYIAKERGYQPTDFDNINKAHEALNEFRSEWFDIQLGIYEPDRPGGEE